MVFLFLRSNLWMNTRVYLVNMSVSDIIMCITAVPVTPYTAFHGSWSFGPAFCHILPLLQVQYLNAKYKRFMRQTRHHLPLLLLLNLVVHT